MRLKSRIAICLLSVVFEMSAGHAATAQTKESTASGPTLYQYLVVQVLKPGSHDAYIKAEQADAQALQQANVPDYYIGMQSITGPETVIYDFGHTSFADMVKVHEAVMANKALLQKLQSTDATEGADVASVTRSLYMFRKDLSLNPDVDFPKMRFMDMLLFHVREGHEEEFEQAVKLYMKAYQTAVPDAYWAMFQKTYGEGSGDTFLLVTPLKSLADEDGMMGNAKKLRSSVGDAQMEAMMKLGASTIASSESNLFYLNPSISYVPNSWAQDSPGFWNK